MMGGGMMGGFGLAGGLIGLIFNIAILIGIVWLVIWAVQKFSRSSNNDFATGRSRSAREILDTRYASGELTGEAYQTILNDLS